MSMKKATYGEVRDRVLPGDVIAFLGDNPLSRLIEVAGTGGVSHVGIILEAGTPAQEPRFVESTVHQNDEKKVVYGVEPSSFRSAHDAYVGTVWWLSLDPVQRAAFNQVGFSDFVTSATGKLFDIPGGVAVVLKGLQQKLFGAGLPQAARIELEKAYCCSTFVANALKKAGVVNVGDPDGVNPSDVCSWRIYAPDYVRLKGDAEITGYNSTAP